MIHLWPTPRATDSDRGGRGELIGKIRGTKGYRGAAVNFPTPTTRDWKDSPGMSFESMNPDGSIRKREDLLPRVIYKEEDESGRSTGGKLNPDWVEWLMGWPLGWTALEPMSAKAFKEWEKNRRDWWRSEPLGVPHTAEAVKDRVNRLKAIGNGQVPEAAWLAWETLTKKRTEKP